MNDANYHGIATVCWQNCPPAMVGCAAGCASSKAQCAMSTTNQVISVALVANKIYGKYKEAYPAAQKATSEMTAFEIAIVGTADHGIGMMLHFPALLPCFWTIWIVGTFQFEPVHPNGRG